MADAKTAHEAKKGDAGLKTKYNDLDAIKRKYTTAKGVIETEEGKMKKFATAEATRVKNLRAEQTKQLKAKRDGMDRVKKEVAAQRAKLE